MIWIAKYQDGSELKEIDNGNENSFFDINRNKLKEFCLYNDNQYYSYFVDDGRINIDGNFIDISYVYDNNEIKLTNNNKNDYSDLIEFKKAHNDGYNFGGNKFKLSDAIIDSYNFGYKTKINIDNDFILYFKPIVSFPTNGNKKYIEINLSSNKTIKGYIQISYKGNSNKFQVQFKEIDGVIPGGKLNFYL